MNKLTTDQQMLLIKFAEEGRKLGFTLVSEIPKEQLRKNLLNAVEDERGVLTERFIQAMINNSSPESNRPKKTPLKVVNIFKNKINKKLWLVIGLLAWMLSSWITHIFVCFHDEKWGFLIAGAIAFPLGIIHGTGLWLGIW